MPANGSRPIPSDLLAKVRRIEITTNRLVDQGLAGQYHSAFKGRGMEFAEVRSYQPGDDVRAIDWNVTARMGTPFVKQFVEERDLTIFLVVDVSGSQSFGSRAILKRELAAEVSALLAFAAIRNQDRVGAALVNDGVTAFLAPERRRNHVLRIVRELLYHPTGGGTDLEAGLEQVLRSLDHRSVLFLISDFVGVESGKALAAAAARHDVIAVEIYEPRDHEPPDTRFPVLLADAESGRLGFGSGRRLAGRIREAREADRRAWRDRFRKLGVDHLTLRTDRPYLQPLVQFFERRRRRLAR